MPPVNPKRCLKRCSMKPVLSGENFFFNISTLWSNPASCPISTWYISRIALFLLIVLALNPTTSASPLPPLTPLPNGMPTSVEYPLRQSHSQTNSSLQALGIGIVASSLPLLLSSGCHYHFLRPFTEHLLPIRLPVRPASVGLQELHAGVILAGC